MHDATDIHKVDSVIELLDAVVVYGTSATTDGVLGCPCARQSHPIDGVPLEDEGTSRVLCNSGYRAVVTSIKQQEVGEGDGCRLERLGEQGSVALDGQSPYHMNPPEALTMSHLGGAFLSKYRGALHRWQAHPCI